MKFKDFLVPEPVSIERKKRVARDRDGDASLAFSKVHFDALNS